LETASLMMVVSSSSFLELVLALVLLPCSCATHVMRAHHGDNHSSELELLKVLKGTQQ